MAESLEIFKQSVFDLEGVPAFQQFYNYFMWPWKYIYKGHYDAWHTVIEKTIKNPNGVKRSLATLNAGKMLCAQLARYEWSERCEITVSREGVATDEPDPLNEYVKHVLNENSFFQAFGELIEKSNALGGGAIKEWVEVPKDRDGNDIGEPKVRLSFHMADQFIPTAWNNHRISEGLFVSRELKDGYYYSTVEWHKWVDGTYRVTNDVYRMRRKESHEPQNILGWWYPLNAVYPLLSPEVSFDNLGRTLFQYIRPFGANWCDDNSPLGVSIYSSALDTLHTLDIMFDSFRREFQLGKKRIIVPARAVRTVVDPSSGRLVRYFDPEDAVYEALSLDEQDANKIVDNSVELRVEEHIAAINAQLAILANQTGFDAGVFSFDKSGGVKTATEVISENSKTYDMVKANTAMLGAAIDDMVHAIIDLASIYGVMWDGVPVGVLAAQGYNVSVHFDDSIVQDRATDINEGILLMNNGLMSKKHFMTKVLGYTPERADAELQAIADEGMVNAGTVDVLYGDDA